MLDGIPGPARTAAMLEPYELNGRPSGDRGELRISLEVLSRAVTQFDRAGLTTKFDASGDAAAREALDAVETARRMNGTRGVRHEVGHSSFVQPADIARAKRIGATLEFSPPFWGVPAASVDVITAVIDSLGRSRYDRMFPVREALDAGVLSVGGSDWPTVPSPNPWGPIEAVVPRWAGSGRRDPPLQARERISQEHAVNLYTSGPARQLGTADRDGAIAVGYRADLVVLDRNPFEIPVTQIHETRVLMTIVAGDIAYDAALHH